MKCLCQSVQAEQAAAEKERHAVANRGLCKLHFWLMRDGLRDCCGRTPVHWACRAGDAAIVEYLLSQSGVTGADADPDADGGEEGTSFFSLRSDDTDHHGDTALHEAARFGRTKVISTLLKLEAAHSALGFEAPNLRRVGLRDQRNNQGQTALDLASHPDVAACLGRRL
jgi:hypothetical protein